MDNPRFIDDEIIPLVQDQRVGETSFTEPDTTEATSTLRLRQKVKLDKLTSL